ncbi:tryptophan-rich sensory protein [candidate division WOR-3 bacterium]|nr:tryptophan-rich sensory protein [candidate division WOR-3 bacterium]
MQRSKIGEFLILFSSIIICQLAGIIGSIFTTPAIPTWYANINKPTFRPPNWVFAPVWTTLYLLMGIALFLVLRKGFNEKGIKIAVAVFALQLVLNSLWSFLFFGLESPFAAFIEIIFLWAAILISIILFFRISWVAGALLIPYILWVSFASVLNFSIWRLNM